MRFRVHPIVIAILAVAGLVGACSVASPGRTVDGWELGAPVECVMQQDFCDRFLDVATSGFNEAEAGHLPVVAKELYEPAKPVARSGGAVYVAVFRLADGSLRALGVGNIGISGPVPFDAPDRPRFPSDPAPTANAN